MMIGCCNLRRNSVARKKETLPENPAASSRLLRFKPPADDDKAIEPAFALRRH
jgi:hypothetical protein